MKGLRLKAILHWDLPDRNWVGDRSETTDGVSALLNTRRSSGSERTHAWTGWPGPYTRPGYPAKPVTITRTSQARPWFARREPNVGRGDRFREPLESSEQPG